MRELFIILSLALSLAAAEIQASEPEEGIDLDKWSELMDFGSIRCIKGEPMPVFDYPLENRQPENVEMAARLLANALNPALTKELPNLPEDCLAELEYKLAGLTGKYWLDDRGSELSRQMISIGAEHGEYMGDILARAALELAQGKITDVLVYMKTEIAETRRLSNSCDKTNQTRLKGSPN